MYQVLSVTELMDKDGKDINHAVKVGDELCEIDGICPICMYIARMRACACTFLCSVAQQPIRCAADLLRAAPRY